MPTENAVDALLRTSGIAASEARMLLVAASGLTREQLITHDGRFAAATIDAYRSLCTRRAAGEPIAYLTGQREFYGRMFHVNAKVLIPRPETELLVEQALLRIANDGAGLSLIDLGTGSGIIAISIACERPALSVTASDVSNHALALARNNAERLDAPIQTIQSNWFTALEGKRYDMIVSNPPYIAAQDAHLVSGDLRYEPRTALTDDADGLSALRRIIADSPSHLNPGGWLLLEHGYDQAHAVRQLLSQAGLTNLQCWRDLAEIERVSAGQLPDAAD